VESLKNYLIFFLIELQTFDYFLQNIRNI